MIDSSQQSHRLTRFHLPLPKLNGGVPIAEEQGVSTGHVYKRKRQKLVITRGKRPADIGSNEEEPVGDVNEADVTQDAEQKKKRRKVTENEVSLLPRPYKLQTFYFLTSTLAAFF